ncbi:hypothetical protein E2562_030107 [Oryza meyeriana var. granulata]|uniref:F-box domain-containing protein n=1 Tax=Oryza meyeriana var. granulata TaxID=110450 RepID=A0A6G1CTJ8_9ORYZ|nr:hypothetical protein E2562_030107 [Oryza meyeriana var. granulata]
MLAQLMPPTTSRVLLVLVHTPIGHRPPAASCRGALTCSLVKSASRARRARRTWRRGSRCPTPCSPTSSAASRRVCKVWRAVVAARGVLLRQALPHAVRGVYLNLVDYQRPRFFARRSSTTGPRVDGDLGFLPGYMGGHSPVRDHCNGLVLCGDNWVFDVANPATRRWERLPRVDVRGHATHASETSLLDRVIPRPAVLLAMQLVHVRHVSRLSRATTAEVMRTSLPRTRMNSRTNAACVRATPRTTHLVFDSAASPHYEVLLLPRVPEKPDPFYLIEFLSLLDDMSTSDGTESSPQPDPPLDYRLMEWPPSPCTLLVFSSRTGQWQERQFAREGEAMGTVADALLDSPAPGVMYLWPRRRYGVYWRGELYIHCRGGFVMRYSTYHGTIN